MTTKILRSEAANHIISIDIDVTGEEYIQSTRRYVPASIFLPRPRSHIDHPLVRALCSY